MTTAAPSLSVRLPGLVEQRLERSDRDRCEWLGCPFSRPATTAERVWLAGQLAEMPARLSTRVEVLRDGTRRRTWPQLDSRPRRKPVDNTDDAD
ncbi:hypothetical protein JNN96_32705 [Mycobacterium sp. DSM 3803]|nr:hypothetical protein [Mycobacterium sp. DSM 3803]